MIHRSLKLNKKLISVKIVAILIFASALYAAKEYSVAQKDRKFSQSALSINVGDAVNFPNEDDFFHNVYSLSPVKIFDLGSYKKGQAKKVVFDKPGVVEVRCAIHPEMKLLITVK